MLTEEKQTMNGTGNHLLAFIGGFIGAMTHYINNLNTLLTVQTHELLDFAIHSLIGGAITVAVKVFSDWVLHLIKKPRQKKTTKEENE